MPKKRSKKTNPNRIPVSHNTIDEHAIMVESSTGNMYYAWLITLPALFQLERLSVRDIAKLWDIVNQHATDKDFRGQQMKEEISRARLALSLAPAPSYPDLSLIRTRGALEAAKKKYKKSADEAALCLIWLGFEQSGMFTSDELKRISLNIQITCAELETGVVSFQKLAELAFEHEIDIRQWENTADF